MKIEVEIPDMWNERHLYIMAGIDVVAYKELGKKWRVKQTPCNMCGECCRNLPERFFFKTVDGVCEHLGSNNTCNLGIARPYVCCVSKERKGQDFKQCSITYK